MVSPYCFATTKDIELVDHIKSRIDLLSNDLNNYQKRDLYNAFCDDLISYIKLSQSKQPTLFTKN